MNKNFNKVIILILFAALFSACDKLKLEEETKDFYAVSLGEFKTFGEADLFKSKIDFKLWNELKIEQEDENRFILAFGKFNSSFEAGQKAFELLSNSLINNYKIIKNNKSINDPFANLFFVAKYQGRLSVYNYNLVKKKSKLFWSRWGRKVLSLNYSVDRNSVFIITALGAGKQAGFPYFRDARLFIYNGEKDRVDEIKEFGSGMQLYSYWENKDTFKVNITKSDSINSEKIIQTIFSFDKDGNSNEIIKRDFSLTKEGFPKPPRPKFELYSASATFQLRIVQEENNKLIYLRDQKKRAEVLIAEFNGEIKNIQWTKDEKNLFLLLNNKDKTANKDELLVIDTSEKIIKRNFTGQVYKNLLVQGNLLFFDQQFEDVAQITIYDFAADLVFDEIQVAGGCGINNLSF